jgi:hypothetical protein
MSPDAAQSRAAHQHSGRFWGIFASRRHRQTGESSPASWGDEDGSVKTRTLMLLAFVTGLAILAAGAIQILLARS